MQLDHVGPQSEERLLTEIEVAKRLQAAHRTIITRRLSGDLPFIRFGRLIRYHWPDVVAHLRRTSPKHGGLR